MDLVRTVAADFTVTGMETRAALEALAAEEPLEIRLLREVFITFNAESFLLGWNL